MSHNVAQSAYVPKRFPTWIMTPDGNRMIVPDCKTMSAMMGEEYDENAELVVKAPPAPPAAESTPDAPEHAQTVEELMADMARQSEQSHADVLKDMDPIGIFATPEPDELKPVVAEKKRGKTAKE